MARLILVRHGETEWNRSLRFQGQSDIELNETGIKEAERTRKRLANEKIDAIYSSDLKRAVKTAEIIACSHGMSEAIIKSPLLREMTFGEVEGLTFDQIQNDYHHVFSVQEWLDRPLNISFPHGEGIPDLVRRTKQFTVRLNEHKPEETILIVAHGGPLQLLICQLLGISVEYWWKIRLSSTSISILDNYPDRPILALLNDVCHLG